MKGCFCMYYQIEQVLEQYGLENVQTYKGRGVLICECGSELLALKSFGVPRKRRNFCICWENT